jgi:hypothetical protein
MGGMTLANGTSGLRGLASNYVLPPLSARSAYNIATINPANLSIIGLSGTRYYDGTATFDANQLTLDGVQGTDSVVLSGSATVASRNVGTYTQWASSNLSLTGAGANNYTYTLNNGSVSAIITPRPLGINVTGIYNGTSNLTINGGALSASNAIFQYTGLVSGETITEVTIASPNVVRNGSNSVVSVTGSNNFDINNYQLGTSQVVSNNLPFNGDQTTTTPLVTTNAVWLKPAPLGVAVSGTYNGTTTMSTVNGAVITPYGLLGQDATGVSLTTATLSSPNLSVPGGNKVVAVTGTGTFDPNNYVLDSSVNATPATAGAALDGSGATNTVNLVEAPTVPPVVLQPPPAAPIIVPAFPDNGIKAIAIDTRPPEFGGMNYVAALFEGATPTSTSPTASGQTQGSAPTASTAPTEGGAMNYVSISSKVTDSGQELQVRLPEDKNRKPQSELNVNNTTVSSNTSPLDVFVVDTGINLSNLNNGK